MLAICQIYFFAGGSVAKQPKTKLTKFEMEIMNYLWQHGPSPIREIQESYAPKSRPAYTTVQTIVYRLETKGAVRRMKKIGNAHIFEPTLSAETAYARAVEDLTAFFGGSLEPLINYLIENKKLTTKDARALASARKTTRSSQSAKGDGAPKQPRRVGK